MAILHRFGSADEFDPSKMQARELAYVNTTNSTYKAGLYLCYAPGDVRRQTTEEDIMNLLNAMPDAYTALQQLLADLEGNPSELTNILSNITTLQADKLDKVGDTKDNTATFAEATEDTDIASGETHATLFGKILKSIKTLRYNIGVLTTDKIDKSAIVNQDAINDVNKVPSSAVTYAHGQAITQLNNNKVNAPLNISLSDLNDFDGCFGYGYGLINAPYSGDYCVLQLPYYSSLPNIMDYGAQLIFDITGINKPKYRVMTDSVWSEWSDL